MIKVILPGVTEIDKNVLIGIYRIELRYTENIKYHFCLEKMDPRQKHTNHSELVPHISALSQSSTLRLYSDFTAYPSNDEEPLLSHDISAPANARLLQDTRELK